MARLALHDHQRPQRGRRRHHRRHPALDRARVDIDGDRITVVPTDEPTPRVPLEFSGLNRIPILLLGPLLHRAHEAFVPLVGGDRIGRRPVDFHVSALQQMGAEVEVQPHGITARMAGRLRGTRITLPYPSVGATETVLLVRGAGRGPHRDPQRRHRARGRRARPLPPAHGRPHRAAPRPALRDRGRRVAHRRRGPPPGRPPRGLQLPRGRPHDRRRGPGGRAATRTASSPPSTRCSGWAPHFTINDTWISATRRAAPARRRADRHPPRVHDRLAAAAHRADDPGRRHVGAPRDRLRGPARLRRGPEGDGRGDRAVRHLPRRSGLPLPRLVRRALRGRAGRVEAPGRRRHDPRRAGRVLVGDRSGRRRGHLHAPRDPPPRAGLQPARSRP